MPTATPRTGRRPGRPDTRAAILASARRLIDAGGCGELTMRAIARDAGVDNALVVHYFGSRDGLLREALMPTEPLDIDFTVFVAAGADGLGERLVRAFLERFEARSGSPNRVARVIGMGTDSAVSRDVLQHVCVEEFVDPLTTALADAGLTDDAHAAAQIAATLMLALVLARFLPAMPHLNAVDDEQLVRRYGRMVQVALTS